MLYVQISIIPKRDQKMLDSITTAKSVAVNKIGIFFLIVLAFLIGIAPALFAVGHFEYIAYFAIAALIGASLGIFRFRSSATEKPVLLEFGMGLINKIFTGASLGSILLLIYLIALGIILLVEFIGHSFGFDIQLGNESTASTVSLVITFFFTLFASGTEAESLGKKLYPNKARVKSAYYKAVTYGKRRLAIYMVTSLLMVVGIFLIAWYTTGVPAVWNIWWFNVLLLLWLLFATASPASMDVKLDPYSLDAIEACKKLFSAIGYQVVLSPSTDRSDIDPLLVGLDFLAKQKKTTIAVTVRRDNSYLYDEWDPSDLARSAWTLETYLREETHELQDSIMPVIIFIGKMDKNWKATTIKTIHIPNSKTIDSILGMNDQKKLKKIADSYLKSLYKPENNGGEL